VLAEDFAAHAAKVKVRFGSQQTPESMQGSVEGLMSRIALDCVAEGTRLIGHIKCIAEIGPERYITCSVTGHDGKARCSGSFGQSSTQLDIIINVLQYGLAKEVLVGIVEKEAPIAFGPDAKVTIEDLSQNREDRAMLRPIQMG
jgi:hypothetical protein